VTIAEKLIIEEKRATAVQVSKNQSDGTPERVTAVARKEILVTSGVQGSAKLLLLRYAASDIQELLSLKLTCMVVVLDP
jgi:choline dehydrogenase-like flavoprotein